MTTPDLLGQLLAREQSGSQEQQRQATRELLQQAADHLGGNGSIPDMRLRCWVVDYLGQQSEALPQHGRGRPQNFGEQFEIALRVELARERRLSRTAAIDHVVQISRFTEHTVEQYHKRFRAAALEWIEHHGPRLPAQE